MIISERAWIIITPVNWNPGLRPLPEAGEIPINLFQAAVRNVGKTPATLVKMAFRYVNLSKGEYDALPGEPKYGEGTVPNGLVLVPSDSVGFSVPLMPSATLTADEVRSISNAERFIYFYGSIRYRDAFGKYRETRVGYVYTFPQGGRIAYQREGFQRGGPDAYNRAT